MMFLRRRAALCLPTLLAMLLAAPPALAGETVTHLHDGWNVQSACKMKAEGDAIATLKFSVDGWLKATVPSTVLATQVADGVFPDPYFGVNLSQLPGAGPAGKNFNNLPMPADSPYLCGWWYRTVFMAPPASRTEGRAWLHFNGINYRADLWLNGHRIADSKAIAGSYRTYDFDVTDYLERGKQNVLALETFSATEMDLSINWMDQAPVPPDKDMGVWGSVDLVTTGAVTVRSPMAATHFRDSSLEVADLTVYAELHNATGQRVRGVASGSAAGVHFERPVELAAHEDRTVVFTPEKFPQLRIHDPKLWWPRQMGQPHLEHLTVAFKVGSETTDEQSVDFGIREITSELTASSNSRLFRINGKPILIRGGAWTQDLLIREDSRRLSDQFKLVADMNLNTIRLEGKLETDEFYRLADEQGILVFAGWVCCDQWEHWERWTPENHEVAAASARSQMLRLRHHASMLVWLNGSDHAPPADVESMYLKTETGLHWPNPILASAGSLHGAAGPTGVKMNGPYDYVPPNYWYVDKQYGGAWGFNTETGPGANIPMLASRQNFLPDPEAMPPTPAWASHNATGHKYSTLKVLDDAMAAIYGKPKSEMEYERMAQAMAYDSERAMFESFNKNKYQATGVIQHMLNNAWPSMIWHLYDYYLEAGAGYFGTKAACEPLHIQYSYDDHSIVVVNSTYQRASGLHASIHVHNAAWKELFAAETAVDAAIDSSEHISAIPDALYSGPDKILFVDLTLSDASGHIVSRNFYWVPEAVTTFDWKKTTANVTPASSWEDLSGLAKLAPAKVMARAEMVGAGSGRKVVVHLQNSSTALAFQVRAAVRTPSGDLIAPVLWSDNWIELAPGESRTLTAQLPEDSVAAPIVQLDGWNIAAETITPIAAATQ
jgi:exo-1,4-beta-D-glucosaminidase